MRDTLGCLDRYSATRAALAQCWRMRSGSVSSPWMNMKALKGLIAAPMSRSRVTRILMM